MGRVMRSCATFRAILAYGLLSMIVNQSAALAAPIRILAFGDSLTAGYNLPPGESFADQLQTALRGKGYDATVIQGGVSGDTTSGGKARLDWVLSGAKADHVILELGANDALRGIDPKTVRTNLELMIGEIQGSGATLLLLGMMAPPNWGEGYQREFDRIYPELAKAHNVPLVPFFLDGVAMDPQLNQADGLHPNEKGVAVIVDHIAPEVAKLLSFKNGGGS